MIAERVSFGETVFVQSDMIEQFMADLHPRIPERYVLITHNSDATVTEAQTKLIDEKILHWFAQNVDVSHPKITPIPIGLENARYAHAGRTALFDRARARLTRSPKPRNGRILAAFSVRTNRAVRAPILESLRSNSLVDVFDGWMRQSEYVEKLSGYSFVASPPGNGIDCHRTWEALYLGTVPIVQPSVCMGYFKSLGMPILATENWDERLRESTSDSRTPTTTGTVSALFLDYWRDLILSYVNAK